MGRLEEELKNKAKNKTRKMVNSLLMNCIPIIIIILVIVIVATSLLSVFTTIKDALIKLASNIRTTLSNFWKNLIDDKWIKLDKLIDFTEDNTRTGRAEKMMNLNKK